MQQDTSISSTTPAPYGPWGCLTFDGSCWPNPGGDMGLAWGVQVNSLGEGPWTAQVADTLGPGTNNQAEYHALLGGLRHAHRLGIRRLVIRGDSQLVINQVQGKWKCKSRFLQAMHWEARCLIKAFSRTQLGHIPREDNTDIDELSRKGPLLRGDTGVFAGDRYFSNQQAAFIRWAFVTERLSAAQLSRIFLSTRSVIRKCAVGETYKDIGVADL